MVRITNIMLTDEGKFKRMSISYDVINDKGETIEVNKRLSRVVTDKDLLNTIDIVMENAESLIKEN